MANSSYVDVFWTEKIEDTRGNDAVVAGDRADARGRDDIGGDAAFGVWRKSVTGLGTMYEFSVEIIDREDDKIAVAGRCLQGPVRVGDRFTSAYRFADLMADDLRHVDETPVSLRVDRIVAYRHELTDLHDGMTARIELSGEGDTVLSQGWVLSGESTT
jgi:hypothetical protein